MAKIDQMIKVELVENSLFITEDSLRDINFPGGWLKTHWAPFWQTCGVCDFDSDLEPGFILKTETLEWDVPEVLSALGMKKESVPMHTFFLYCQNRINEIFQA